MKNTIIETNINANENIHDSILYPSIEKQVYDLFKHSVFENVTYIIEGRVFFIKVNNFRLAITISKNVKIKMEVPSEYNSSCYKFAFGEYAEQNKIYPIITLPYNKDITKKINEFTSYIQKLEELHEKGEKIYNWFKDNINYAEKIKEYLINKLGTDELTVSFWTYSHSLFSGLETTFSIHPIGEAPADGVSVCFEKGTHKITPFWNNSTERRSHYSDPETFERAFKINNSSIADMKKRIEVIEKLEKNIKEFKVESCPELKEYLSKKEEADKLLELVYK